MIPQAPITAWRAVVPWPDDAQVEQDLVLTRAVVEMFANLDLASKIALRGGTSLNKLFLRPASRYSEDIDLVQVEPGPIGPLLDSIRGALDPWLGKPRRSRAEGGARLVYRFDSEIPPVRPLRLKIEINTREHFTVLGIKRSSLDVTNPWFTGKVEVATYELDELMGTKLRALYQRRKGRDLFDLWVCLTRNMLDPTRVISCFLKYLAAAGQSVSRAEYEQNLHGKRNDSSFLTDIAPLLATDVRYNAAAALVIIQEQLIAKLPGEPWRGMPGPPADRTA